MVRTRQWLPQTQNRAGACSQSRIILCSRSRQFLSHWHKSLRGPNSGCSPGGGGASSSMPTSIGGELTLKHLLRHILDRLPCRSADRHFLFFSPSLVFFSLLLFSGVFLLCPAFPASIRYIWPSFVVNKARRIRRFPPDPAGYIRYIGGLVAGPSFVQGV